MHETFTSEAVHPSSNPVIVKFLTFANDFYPQLFCLTFRLRKYHRVFKMCIDKHAVENAVICEVGTLLQTDLENTHFWFSNKLSTSAGVMLVKSISFDQP